MAAGGGVGLPRWRKGMAAGCHLDGWRCCGVLPVAKARVVLMASGRVETVRLTLTCRDTVCTRPFLFFFFCWHEVTLQLSNQNDTGTCRR